MHYDVQKSIWFNRIGIVKVKTKFSGMKYYIGKGKGQNKFFDEQLVLPHLLSELLRLLRVIYCVNLVKIVS